MKRFYTIIFLLHFISCGNSEKLKESELKVLQLTKTVDSLRVALDDTKNGAERLYSSLLQAEKDGNYLSLRENYESLKDRHSYFKDLDKATEIYNRATKKEKEEKKKKEAELKRIEAEKAKSLTKLKKKYDDVSGITWYYNPYFNHNIDSNKASIYMGVRDGNKTNPWINLLMSYYGDDWIFFERAYLSFEGRTIEIFFNEYENKKTDNHYGGVYEWLEIEVTPDILNFLEDMTAHGKGKMRLSGKYTKTRDLSSNEIKGMKDVISGYHYLKNQ